MGLNSPDQSQPTAHLISTPDQRLRVFVSSTLNELGAEREVIRSAIQTLRLTPVMFESGARAHPPDDLYRSYLEQSDVFVGIYWQSYGWVAPNATVSGIAEELARSSGMPRLTYIKQPAPERDPKLEAMLEGIRDNASVSYRAFSTPEELSELVLNDLAVLVSERFHTAADTGDRTLTFLFADLEGSTAMVERLGDGYRVVLRQYHQIVNDAVPGHGGHIEVTEGDGFFCVFNSPVDAVESAQEILTRMEQADWPESERPRCRIGIHTGTATRTPEGYVGLDVHRAARIGAAANGGQILVSTATATLIEDHVRQKGRKLTDVGEYRLEGLGREERLYRVDVHELEVVTTTPRARARPSINLPSPPRAIVGRIADVRGATEMLMRDNTRMVTITGPGGTGKTRLALEIAHNLKPEFPGGVVFADLSAVHDPTLLLPTVARALGVQESAVRDVFDRLETVIGSSRMLLVMDNLEQLLDAAPDIGRLLERLPQMRILATSRSPLRLTWENEYPLSPLPVPAYQADAEAIRESDAVALFVERARAVRADFALDGENDRVVAEITRNLDGLPLAIELAAARLRIFPVEALLERLDNRLSLLAKGASDAPERHRTLRSAIQWSHDLLDDDEKTVFRRLSVFAEGWSLEAAIHICCDSEMTEARVLDVLHELVAKSMVVFALDEIVGPRYRMLETLREFSHERLVEAGEENELGRRHLSWCLLKTGAMTDILPTPRFPAFLDLIETERMNIRKAVEWALDTGEGLDDAMSICGFLPLFFDTRGYVTEGVNLTGRLVSRTEGVTVPRGRALTALGWLAMLAGESDASEDALVEAEQIFRALGEDGWLCRTLAMHGMTTFNRNDLDAAELQFQEAIDLCGPNGLQWLGDAWCAYGLAHIALVRGEFQEAYALLEQALTYSKEHGLTWGVGHSQLSLGVLAFMMGNLDQAFQRLSESARVRQDLRDSRGICDCLGVFALLASVKGDHEFCAVILGSAEVAREASGQRVVPWLQPMLEQAVMSAQLALKEDYEIKVREGRRLSADEAIESVLQRFAMAEPTMSAS